MKIGILTFHWGTNYGGVLQAYALQTFLKRKGHDVAIINYAPHTFRDSFIKCFYSKNPFTIIDNLKNYWKEKNIAKFRNNYLIQSERYFTPEQLIENPPQMDIYISGSDQIWNPYGLKSNKKIYFLPFGDEKSIKLSYAASFGIIDYPENLIEEIKPLLNKFKAISVREKSGLEILKCSGINNGILLPDPTLLLEKIDYLEILKGKETNNKNDYFFYVLQKKQNTIRRIYKSLKKNKHNKIIHTSKIKYTSLSIENWLNYIKNSKMVITNSFHGVVFSIIFNTPFIVVPIEGELSVMNDRIITLLEKFELKDRVIEKYEEIKFKNILQKNINWKLSKKIIKNIQLESISFFRNNLNKKANNDCDFNF